MNISSSANQLNESYIKCDIDLSKKEIISGEPINLRFSFTNISSKEINSITLMDAYDLWGDSNNRENTECMKIIIKDSEGNDIPRRNLLCRPDSQRIILLSFPLKPNETVFGEYPLHLRYSTLLKPGQYHVFVNNIDVWYNYKPLFPELGDPGTNGECISRRIAFSGKPLALAIKPYDEKKLVASYAEIMEKARDAILHPISSGVYDKLDYLDIASSIRTILWAEGPIAIPFQIEILYDSEEGFRYWPPAVVNTWDNIVHYATPEQIKNVLVMAKGMGEERNSMRKYYYSSRYSPGLAWAIHEWNTNGSEEIKELTQELVEKLPEEEPCPPPMERGTLPYGKNF